MHPSLAFGLLFLSVVFAASSTSNLSITSSASLPAQSVSCNINYTTYSENTVWQWYSGVNTSTFTAATVLYYVNNATNTTSSTTISNQLPSGVVAPPTNSAGTHIAVITLETGYSEYLTTTMTFPTTVAQDGPEYTLQGTINTTDAAGRSVCSTISSTVIGESSVSLSAGPGTTPTDDPKGLLWYITEYNCNFDLVVQGTAAFQNGNCPVSGKTVVSLLTDSSTIHVNNPAPTSSTALAQQSSSASPPVSITSNTPPASSPPPPPPPTSVSSSPSSPVVVQPPPPSSTPGNPPSSPGPSASSSPPAAPLPQSQPSNAQGAPPPPASSSASSQPPASPVQNTGGNGQGSPRPSASPPAQNSPPPIVVGSSTYSASVIVSNGGTSTDYIIGSQTLVPGSTIVVNPGQSAQTVGIQTGANSGSTAVVVNGHTSNLPPAPTPTPTPLVIGSQTATGSTGTNGSPVLVIGSQTVSPGATVTIGSGPSAQTVGVQTGSNGQPSVVINGQTTNFPSSTPAPSPLIVGGFTATTSTAPNGTPVLIIGSQTITAGSTATIGSGSSATTLVYQTTGGATQVVVNGHTSTLSATGGSRTGAAILSGLGGTGGSSSVAQVTANVGYRIDGGMVAYVVFAAFIGAFGVLL